MNPNKFERELRQHLAREPFEAFVVEVKSGRSILIDRRAVAINGGGAGFLSDRDGLVDIEAGDVRHIMVPSSEGATS